MSNFLKLFNYSGSKQYIIKDVNFLLQNKKFEVFYELFLGSGTIFLNVKDRFDEYVVNDFSKDICNVFHFVKNFNYTDLINIDKEIKEKFGDIKNNKESFTKFKDFFNEFIWNKEKPEEGGYFYFLLNSCFNSMPKFGKNGFSTGFGNRMYLTEEKDFSLIKNKLSKTTILNKSYLDVEIKEGSFVFLDPPYFKRPGPYSSNFSDSDYYVFLKYLNNLNLSFIYTDVDSKDFENFKKIKLRKIQNSSPHKRVKEEDTTEVMYFNFV